MTVQCSQCHKPSHYALSLEIKDEEWCYSCVRKHIFDLERQLEKARDGWTQASHMRIESEHYRKALGAIIFLAERSHDYYDADGLGQRILERANIALATFAQENSDG